MYIPMAAQQLYGIVAAVFYGNTVAKNEPSVLGVGVLRQVLRFHRNGDSVGCKYFHERKLRVLLGNFKAES